MRAHERGNLPEGRASARTPIYVRWMFTELSTVELNNFFPAAAWLKAVESCVDRCQRGPVGRAVAVSLVIQTLPGLHSSYFVDAWRQVPSQQAGATAPCAIFKLIGSFDRIPAPWLRLAFSALRGGTAFFWLRARCANPEVDNRQVASCATSKRRGRSAARPYCDTGPRPILLPVLQPA